MNDLVHLDARSFHAHLAGLLRAEFERRRSFRDLGYASLFERGRW